MTSRHSVTPLFGDAGSSLLTSSVGILVFLVFLLFATQLLVNLWHASVVTSTAHDGASRVASADVRHDDAWQALGAQHTAEVRMRELLGRQGERATFDWTGSDSAQVVLRVQLDAPRFGVAPWDDSIPYNRVDRTVRVRVETAR